MNGLAGFGCRYGLFALLAAGGGFLLASPLPATSGEGATAFAHSTPATPLPDRNIVLPVMDCAALRSIDFAGDEEAPAVIQSASIEPATAERPEFCLVKGRVAPQVGFELRLPTSTYTGRYLQGGCGGNCGFIGDSLSPDCSSKRAYRGEFAIGFNNAGHASEAALDTLWARNEGLREDFAHRGVHVAAIASKATIAAFYGEAPAYSYFQGCSNGGREGLMEVQRYPDDFDGVVAGAPNYLLMEKVERYLWEATKGRDEQGNLHFDEAAAQLLHRAVMEACDGLDGLVDGQIDDPRRCHYDPREIECGRTIAREACLTPAQAQAAYDFYRGPHTEDGKALYIGGMPYGGELSLGSSGAFANAGATASLGFLRDMLPPNAAIRDFEIADWTFDEAGLRRLQEGAELYNADDPDIRDFAAGGGKLILWQGAADVAAGSYAVYDYYHSLQELSGGIDQARDYARLFVVPGVYHCRSGYIAYEFDLLGPIVRWVETGAAPDSVEVAAELDDGTMRNRPVFAYPFQARYKGTGDINLASSFAGAMPDDPVTARFEWLGRR